MKAWKPALHAKANVNGGPWVLDGASVIHLSIASVLVVRWGLDSRQGWPTCRLLGGIILGGGSR